MKATKILLCVAVYCLVLPVQSCKKNDAPLKTITPVNTDSQKKVNAVTDMISGLYKIVSLNSYWVASKYLNIYGTTDGSLADQQDYNVGTGQDWAVNDLGGGDFALVDLNSEKCLEVPNGVATAGVQLWQKTYTGATGQKWNIVYQGYGLYRMVSKLNASLGVNVEGGSTASGARIILDNFNTPANSYFFFNQCNLGVDPAVRVARITGASPVGEPFPNPNNTTATYNLGGTDLGIMWDMGGGKVGMFFGDSNRSDWFVTSGGGPAGTFIGHNTLAFSTDSYLDDGLTFSSMINTSGAAKEVVTGRNCIPTAATRIGTTDYVYYMDVATWSPSLATNYSRFAKSTNSGSTWTKLTAPSFSGSSKFALGSLAQRGGYVYFIGTPVYRSGPAYLARFTPANILNQATYQYWNGSTGAWVTNSEASATDLFAGTATTSPAVGEASLYYNGQFRRWIFTYFDPTNYQISMRDATNITGPWSEIKVLATGADYPGLYGSYIHPIYSSGDELYFSMSMWWQYNTFLMRAHLSVVN